MFTLANVHANLRQVSDVSLVSDDGKPTTIHPLILSAKSSFFRELLTHLPSSESHPIIILPGFSYIEVNIFLDALIGKEPCENKLFELLHINQNFGEEKDNNGKHKIVNIKENGDESNTFDMKEENICVAPKEIKQYNKQINIVDFTDSEKDIKCPYCDKIFTTNKRMQCHLSLAHESNKEYLLFMKERETNDWLCKVCFKIFALKKTCKKHLLLLHKLGTALTCEVCHKSFEGNSSLNEHKKSHTNTCIVCDLCGTAVSTERYLKRHRLQIHASEEEKNRALKYACTLCPKRFYTKHKLVVHEYIHSENTNNFSCDRCSESFKTPENLRSHRNTKHLGKLSTQSARERSNARNKVKRREKKLRNGGVYRVGEERLQFNDYMRKWTQKKKLQNIANLKE